MIRTDHAGPLPGELSALRLPETLAPRYRRLALISHARHIPLVETLDDTLVVSTDWLAWRQLADGGRPAIHFEAMLGEWPAERGDPADCHLRHGLWVYVDGKDGTLFRGTSLGKTLIRNVSVSMNAFERLWCALNRACERWQPEEILFLDVRAELDVVTPAMKALLVRELAARHGARLVDRADAPPSGDPGFSERLDGYFLPPSDPPFRWALRTLLTEGMDLACRLRDVLCRRTPVLVMSNWATVQGMLGLARRDSKVALAVIAGHLPKRPALVWEWLRKGVVLVSQPPARLNSRDRAELAAMQARFEAHWRACPAASPVEEARRLFVRDLFAAGRFGYQAEMVKQWRRVFARRRFQRVVVGDATNDAARVVIEAARHSGVPADELLNGMFVTRQRYDVRCGDGHEGPSLSRLLSWGRQNEDWLAATGAGIGHARTGYPALDPLWRRQSPMPRGKGRALVLPVYADCDDTQALTSNIFAYLVEMTAALRRSGYAEVRVKLHSGPQNLEYYRAVLALYGLEVEVVKGGALLPHLDWADLVVGPVNSGAFVETLAAGRPYVPVLPPPSLIDPALLGPVRTIADAAALSQLLADDKDLDRAAVLEYFCDAGTSSAAAARVWSVFEADTAEAENARAPERAGSRGDGVMRRVK